MPERKTKEDKMTEGKGKCRHGEFDLFEGCPQCIAERMAVVGNIPDMLREAIAKVQPSIVKVKYYSEITGELSAREYTYYSADRLSVGDIVIVPVRDTTGKAKVSAVDVSAEIASFKDKVKTIPTGSIVRADTITKVGPEELTPEEELEQAPFLKQVEEDIGALATEERWKPHPITKREGIWGAWNF